MKRLSLALLILLILNIGLYQYYKPVTFSETLNMAIMDQEQGKLLKSTKMKIEGQYNRNLFHQDTIKCTFSFDGRTYHANNLSPDAVHFQLSSLILKLTGKPVDLMVTAERKGVQNVVGDIRITRDYKQVCGYIDDFIPKKVIVFAAPATTYEEGHKLFRQIFDFLQKRIST